MSSEEAATEWLVCDIYPEVEEKIGREYQSGDFKCQPWRVFPAYRLQKIWKEFAAGFIRDEKGLDLLETLVIENTVRLNINTEVAGHSGASSRDAAESIIGDLVDTEFDRFVDWCIDTPEGGWRISDYAMPKLIEQVIQLRVATDPIKKLMHIDIALNIMHQRSDLASWFVEGGSRTLNRLTNEFEDSPHV